MWGAARSTANLTTGVRKHRTVIGAGSKTGANSVAWSAPIKLGIECDGGSRLHPHRDVNRMGPWRSAAPPSGSKPTGLVLRPRPSRWVSWLQAGDQALQGQRPGWP